MIRELISLFLILFLILFFQAMPAGEVAWGGEREEKLALSAQENIHLARESHLQNRLQELERKVSWLGEEIRFLKERTRNLDRRIDDLRVRHV